MSYELVTDFEHNMFTISLRPRTRLVRDGARAVQPKDYLHDIPVT